MSEKLLEVRHLQVYFPIRRGLMKKVVGHVHAVEVVNSCQPAEVNGIAALYAAHYGLLETFGSDNHWGAEVFARLRAKGLEPVLTGMCSDVPLESVSDFIRLVREGRMKSFQLSAPET